ncbi:MAG: hypothetical protein D6729_12350 [Deltaproteobacteria bacterium]|nr:MAG: hypothetical protein D6729_12350 [Deltaproteobacteria bacterium]
MDSGPRRFTDDRTLAVVVRLGAFCCGIEASLVERLATEPRDPARDRVLAELLEVPSDGPPAAWVHLSGAAPALGVDEVMRVEDVGDKAYYALPTRCRLKRPAFRGVWATPAGLLPCLDPRGVLAGVST